MSRPRKLDALSPAERARRYRARRAGPCVTETVTETYFVFEVSAEGAQLVAPLPAARRVTEIVTETDWPFPGTAGWYQKHGFCVADPFERVWQ